MLSWKKLAKFAMAGGLAFGIMLNSNSLSTFAAEASTNVISVDYTTQIATITVKTVAESTNGDRIVENGDPHYVFVSAGKAVARTRTWDRLDVQVDVQPIMVKDPSSNNMVQKVDAEGKKLYKRTYFATVNVSLFTSPSVKYDIKAYTDLEEPADAVTLAIGNQTKKLTAKYEPLTKTLTVTNDEGELKDDKKSNYEVKTLYGTDWITGDELDTDYFDSCAVYGTTLVVRQRPTLTTPTSKEVKVKIPKKANGPKATINPTSLTVSIPNNAVWRVIGDTQRNDTGFEGSYIWTESEKNKDGWITNSTKGVQSLEILQTAVSEAKATISSKIPVLNPNFKAKDDTTADYTDRSKYGQYILKTDKTKATDTLAEAAMEDIKPDVLSNGAVLELKTVATAKKAESKISYFNIPAQNPAVEYGTDFTVTYEPDKKGEKVANVEFKNLTGVKLQVAIADSNYDITKVKFATVDKNTAKKYGAGTAKDGKVLLVRTASVAANAKTNTVMELGGKETVYSIVHPKQAGSLSNYKFTKKDGTEGASTLVIPTPAAGKKYAYEKVTEKVEKLKVCATLPESAKEIKKTNNVVSEELTGLKTGSLVVVYEYNESDELVTAFVCYELKADDIGTAAKPTTVIVGDGSVQGITAGDKKITGLTAGGKYVVQIGEKYCPVLAGGTLGSEVAAKGDAETAAVELTGTEITGLINGTTYIVTEVAAIGG